MIRSWLCIFVLISMQIMGDSYDPPIIYLTWQRSPETTMTIQWITSERYPANTLLYQEEGLDYWEHAEGAHTPMPNGHPDLIHSVELTGLNPDTVYHFRFDKEGIIYKFRTMPARLDKPIRFAVGGDMYHDSIEKLKETNFQAARTDPMFVLIGGDIAYSFGRFSSKKETTQRWLDWLKEWKNDMITSEGYLIPMVPTIGNHEVYDNYDQTPEEAPFFYAAFPMPGLQGYNVLDFGDYMSIFMLDSDHTHPITGEQTEWLKKSLAAREDVPSKFAIYHVPAYPSVRKLSTKVSEKIRQNWVPLFEYFGLTTAFENHDHAYKRTHPILNGKVDPKGVLYLGDGAWGVDHPRKPKKPRWNWYLAQTAQERHFILVTIDPEIRRFFAVNSKGHLIDSYMQKTNSQVFAQ